MKKYIFCIALSSLLIGCAEKPPEEIVEEKTTDETKFQWKVDQFADIKVLRYQVPGFDQLTDRQKKLVYYLNQAGLSGRDIMWDQNYRHNLKVRKALEKILENYAGDKTGNEWEEFVTYAKRVFFSNGIHHHYSNDKIIPGFSQEYFRSVLSEVGHELAPEVLEAMFDPAIDAKKVNLDTSKGLIKGSAVNFYSEDLTVQEVDEYYKEKIAAQGEEPLELGLNSKLVKNPDGTMEERVWKVAGMYGEALEKVVYWLERAKTVAENEQQAQAFDLLIDYYRTGDLETWDKYNVAWVENATDIDYINGFVEVYNDPKAFRGSYETIVQITDFDMSQKMQVLSENAQWFEDNSPLIDSHKKKNVQGVKYKVVNVAGEAGDASPSTPIGVNLPNNNWIRQKHGSKSVSLGNIIFAYSQDGNEAKLKEFAHDEEEIQLEKEYGILADKMLTALHEVVGHASGQINAGVGQPKETLKNYASTMEEGRADLVGLYFLYNPKLQELGLVDDWEKLGKASYDGYIRNALVTQMTRLQPGSDIEEAHMRNRQMVAGWAYEKGKADNVIEKVNRDGKTYFNINDYEKLHTLFGELLRESQRIKSEGDYEAASALIEGYGVKVDQAIHKEVLNRNSQFKSAPYSGFVNPIISADLDEEGNASNVAISYPENFLEQMLYYGKQYAFLPEEN
ncbi:dihydrofolate reductase [Fulvivirga sp. M361]|uniref:dipeptidyl-peptidase 3 family protein n=1 Tax=Fulvivirga sp. M361 TaxID=2594266 RepID=UPI00117B1AC8|nr:dihydrofolate reductase [Fulvivirga sp. M361]TRX59061.1 dihydrofolate reductase [Fulvivirga sp. M361]